MTTTPRQSLTTTQQLAEDLALAYRGFMRGLDTENDFDIWYWGDKLLKAQTGLGFEMVAPAMGLTALIEASYQKLAIAAAKRSIPFPATADFDVVAA